MKTMLRNKRAALALLCVLFLLLAGCGSVAAPTSADSRSSASFGTGPVSSGKESGGDEINSPDTCAPEAFPAEDKSSDHLSVAAGLREYGMDSAGIPALAEASAPEAGGPVDIPAEPLDPGSPLTLTAGEWNDNTNWSFFTNLVTGGTVRFPSFGIDPRNRIAVTVRDEGGNPLANEAVVLTSEDGLILWAARTDYSGAAFLFFPEGRTPGSVLCGDVTAPVQVTEGTDAQGVAVYRQAETLELTVTPSAAPCTGTQIMFIVDTTGSMGDELAYLQKDFSAITQRVEGDDVSYCACFYRDDGDDYVTKLGAFTGDVKAVQEQLAVEYAEGGGDTPEAVDRILKETLVDFDGWRDDCVKLAFLIFDAPPHEGTDETLQQAVKAAAQKGIRLIPVVASNAERDTELFGRALSICTGGTYVFLTDHSGVGESHLEPIVGDYDVRLLQDLIVEIIARYQG